ncbi:MAG: HNH endonuclease [Lachnospiraceae bacterium]|nr:HNH endonuclease [Lachnospiraceae bacterium]
MRDDFPKKIKELLANRVGCKCSNPSCRKSTRGAAVEKTDFINIGVASHITAASEDGPRYDENMTAEERKSFENGIWLCQSCSKLIDSDVKRYTIDTLKTWKDISERMAVLDLEETVVSKRDGDKELIKFFVQCFDRPAFQDEIHQEGSMEDFDKAIEDTIIALNTGVLRTRDGSIIKESEGKSAVENLEWREKLDTICDMLVALRKRLKLAKETGAYSTYGEGTIMYIFYDKELEMWFDSTREEILKILSVICEDIGVEGLRFRRKRYRW